MLIVAQTHTNLNKVIHECPLQVLLRLMYHSFWTKATYPHPVCDPLQHQLLVWVLRATWPLMPHFQMFALDSVEVLEQFTVVDVRLGQSFVLDGCLWVISGKLKHVRTGRLFNLEDIKLFTKYYENRPTLIVQCGSGTYTVLMSSGFGTQLSRCESSWNAWLWGSNINRPYRALMRYGLCSTSSSWRRRSAKRVSVNVERQFENIWETVWETLTGEDGALD